MRPGTCEKLAGFIRMSVNRDLPCLLAFACTAKARHQLSHALDPLKRFATEFAFNDLPQAGDGNFH